MARPIEIHQHNYRHMLQTALRLTAIIVATGWILGGVLLPTVDRRSPGLSTAYTAAHLAIRGQLGPPIYDDGWFTIQARRLGVGDGSYGVQPPTMALLMTPVAWMQPIAARPVWLSLDLLWLLGIGVLTLGLAYRAGAGIGLASVTITILAISIYRPLHADLRDAQVDTLLALLTAVWLYSYTAGHDRLCGLTLAVLTLLAPAGTPLWLALLAAHRWRALVWAIGLILIGFLASLPLVGLETWQAYRSIWELHLAPGGSGREAASQTILHLLWQISRSDLITALMPQNLTVWFTAALWLIGAVLLLWTTLAWVRSNSRLFSGAAAICLVAPLQINGESHYGVITLAPLLLVLVLIAPTSWRAPITLALSGLSLVLLLAPIDLLESMARAAWLRALLSYLPLYGTLTLWGALIALRPAARTAALTGVKIR